MTLRFALLVLLAIITLAAELTVSNEDRFEHPTVQPPIQSENFEHPQLQRPEGV